MTADKARPRLRRKDSFFGLHYDFHAGDDCTEVGRRVTRAMIRELCRKVKPDFLQCDCKGHRGLSSYPTKVGHPAPGFIRDQLRIWREVTAAEGIGLYMHYSGVWDNEALKHHPSWARIDEQGKRDKKNTSVFGPYVDRLLIPQLKELIDVYGVDGVWIDGDCWATQLDYGPRVLEAFRRTRGIRAVPRKPTDKHYDAFKDFCRDAFRRYLAHYADAVHAHNPDFQVCSNWAYSSFMPEPVKTPVDFLSGDYSLQDSVNTARLEARYLAQQGMPWDLMAWSFSGKFGEGAYSTKSLAQLQQEAAVVLSLGGGFQAYAKQRRDGSIHRWMIDRLAALGQFCRERQAVCHQSEAVPQIGLILSTDWFYQTLQRPFSPWPDVLLPLQGILKLLLDGQNAVDLVSEHHLAGRIQEYPLLVLPETEPLRPKFRKALLDYVHKGGNLLIVGPKAAAQFRSALRIRWAGPAVEQPRWLEYDGELAGLKTLFQPVIFRRGVKSFGRVHKLDDVTADPETAAGIARLGRGRIAGVYMNLGERGIHASTTVARNFLNGLVHELFPDPVVEVQGSHQVDVVVRRKESKLTIHLINTAGAHANTSIHVHDEIPAVGPLTVTIRVPSRPKRILLKPGRRSLRFTYRAGKVELTVRKLAIHSILVVE